MNQFQFWIENRQDEAIRQEAMSIANRIIDFIDSPTNKYGKGLPYSNFKNVGFELGEIIPEHPRLRLKFTNQPGFGKNTSMGDQLGNTISVALPSRTRTNSLGWAIGKDGRIDRSRRTISDNVRKFLIKPDNYDTLIHEIMHYLDQKRIGYKVFKNYPDEQDSAYFNHPAEYNAFLQAFLSKMTKYSSQVTWDELVALINKEYWFVELNDKFKRRVLQRAYEWFAKT